MGKTLTTYLTDGYPKETQHTLICHKTRMITLENIFYKNQDR